MRGKAFTKKKPPPKRVGMDDDQRLRCDGQKKEKKEKGTRKGREGKKHPEREREREREREENQRDRKKRIQKENGIGKWEGLGQER